MKQATPFIYFKLNNEKTKTKKMENINEKINFRAYLQQCAQNTTIYGQPVIVVDVNRWGVSEYNSDPENYQFYRSSLFELYRDVVAHGLN